MVGAPRPRLTPVSAARIAACHVDLPASFGPPMTFIPGASSSSSPVSPPNACALTRTIHTSANLQVGPTLKCAKARKNHAPSEIFIRHLSQSVLNKATPYGRFSGDSLHVV